MNVKGRIDWRREDTSEGHRKYTITWLCTTTSATDGPQTAAGAGGLAAIGAAWAYGGDSDAWATCTPELRARPTITNEPGLWWVVEQVFATPGHPDLNRERCQDDAVENPLLEPDRISGSFVKYTKEATEDRHGDKIKSSSHEMFRGAAVEFDENRPTVSIGKNVGTLPIATFSGMVDTVNSGAMWGVGARHVKLSGVSWERLMYGSCNFYYDITYDFDIRDDDLGFDRKIIDEGTKVLTPGGDKTKPEDFMVYKDVNGENTRVLLDGNGEPLKDGANPFEIEIEYYDESNFLSLGIPASL
jgi:hypothetical protein